MSHNFEQDHRVVGYEAPGNYIKEIIYSAPLQQMIALIDNSIDCKQYIEIKCKQASFGITYINHWWQNRNGTKMYNWGAPTGTVGCDCSTRSGINGMLFTTSINNHLNMLNLLPLIRQRSHH